MRPNPSFYTAAPSNRVHPVRLAIAFAGIFALIFGWSQLTALPAFGDDHVAELAGNPHCADQDRDEGKVDAPSGSGEVSLGDGTVVYTVDGKLLSWTSDVPVASVIVKGGDSANVYSYDPASFGDSGLHAPDAGQSGEPATISHVQFCLGAVVEEEEEEEEVDEEEEVEEDDDVTEDEDVVEDEETVVDDTQVADDDAQVDEVSLEDDQVVVAEIETEVLGEVLTRDEVPAAPADDEEPKTVVAAETLPATGEETPMLLFLAFAMLGVGIWTLRFGKRCQEEGL